MAPLLDLFVGYRLHRTINQHRAAKESTPIEQSVSSPRPQIRQTFHRACFCPPLIVFRDPCCQRWIKYISLVFRQGMPMPIGSWNLKDVCGHVLCNMLADSAGLFDAFHHNLIASA